jgi:hypothetical protein
MARSRSIEAIGISSSDSGSRIQTYVGRLNVYCFLEESLALVICGTGTDEQVDPNGRPNVNPNLFLGATNPATICERVLADLSFTCSIKGLSGD